MDIQNLIENCEDKLEKNLVSSAIHDLHDEVYKEPELHKRADIRLLYARLLGHIGELSETLRTIDELRYENTDNQYKIHSIVYSAMCWSRLMEHEKAKEILLSINPPEDAEYLVHYFSHLLSIAFEMNDIGLMQKHLTNVKQIIDGGTIKGIPLQEILIWKTIFETYLKSPFTAKDIEDAEEYVINRVNISGKKSFIAYIYLRIGDLYERLPDKYNALERYKKARQKAFVGNHGIALLMSNLAIINIENNEQEKKRLIKETCVIAGQHGIGLIHCNLSYTIWKHIDSLSKPDMLRCKQWLLTDRYLPDIERLIDSDFEDLCAKLLKSHEKDIFNAEINVEQLKSSNPIIDIEVTGAALYSPLKLGIQCKGGKKMWTKSALQAELETKGSPLNGKFYDLQRLGYNGFILMTTTNIHNNCKDWLDEIHKDVFQRKCLVLDANDIKSYLRENPHLRMIVAMAINK